MVLHTTRVSIVIIIVRLTVSARPFYLLFVPFLQEFKIAVEGRDKTGHTFRRLNPVLVSTLAIQLQVLPVSGTCKTNVVSIKCFWFHIHCNYIGFLFWFSPFFLLPTIHTEYESVHEWHCTTSHYIVIVYRVFELFTYTKRNTKSISILCFNRGKKNNTHTHTKNRTKQTNKNN